MKDDFEIIVRRFEEREDIKIYGIFDPHLGAKEHQEHEFLNFRDMVLKDKHSFVVIGGDLLNNSTRSSIANPFDEVMRPREQKRLMAEILRPLAEDNRILCCTSGNHEKRSLKDADDDPLYDICAKLDIEHLFRPNLAFLRLQFGKPRGRGEDNPTYRICVAHGAAGGSLTGSAVNHAEKYSVIIDGIDLLMIGHSHKPFVTSPSKIVFPQCHDFCSVKPLKVVSVSSWMNYGGYAAQKLLAPTSTPLQTIILSGKKKHIEVAM